MPNINNVIAIAHFMIAERGEHAAAMMTARASANEKDGDAEAAILWWQVALAIPVLWKVQNRRHVCGVLTITPAQTPA
jgi:hypothetical protein